MRTLPSTLKHWGWKSRKTNRRWAAPTTAAARRDKHRLLSQQHRPDFPARPGYQQPLTEAGQPVGGEVKGRGFVVVQRTDEFGGQRRLGQAQVLVAEGEEQAIFAVNDGPVYRTA